MSRKYIDQYAAMRSCNGNLIEKAVLNQPMQNFRVKENNYQMVKEAIRNHFDFGKHNTRADLIKLIGETRQLGFEELASEMENDML